MMVSLWWRRIVLLLVLLVADVAAGGGDAEALLSLKSSLDRSDVLPWRAETAAGLCSWWAGVRQCDGQGRVRKLVLEGLNLTALLYLADNRLEGRIPGSLAALHRATVIVLSGNRLSGQIPASLTAIPRLTSLLLDRNMLTGPIPPLRQRTLRLLNAPSGSNSNAAAAAAAPLPSLGSRHGNKAAIVAGATVAGAVVLAIPGGGGGGGHQEKQDQGCGWTTPLLQLLLLLLLLLEGGMVNKIYYTRTRRHNLLLVLLLVLQEEEEEEEEGGEGVVWEREGIGKLVFTENEMLYTLEELLRASAETLGRGELGSTYKAVMETGFIVTVKRMRDPSNSSASSSSMDFGRRAEELGRVRHPNIVPLRAYFQAKEERLLVYDYYPNGSIFALVHGSRAASKGKPLHWTSCMKIAEDVAAGLLHLHQSSIVHGNLKPFNVLLGPDFESCLTDYGLLMMMMMLPDHVNDASSTSLLYRAPEAHRTTAFTAASDVYSFGVLLLELLTGRTPFQDLLVFMNEDDHITSWVRAVREEERDTDSSSGGTGAAADEKLAALIGIAAACVAADPERRPTTAEVLRMVREARAEAISSSNSSDRSPARWSDAILAAPSQPFPTDY
ncbi:hypothetical protein PR202_ga03401 [Eleusine coracana subsp. coracana]|uniref:Protein kinase domain-containing protein n=1 Tax=Eleusine coracana subsp. coracana TaxID=191504 RepID=A0AAV5BPR8_ELECO|nr:hypothetical protein PR202_ga03401 [Eleusine coracana subsp. coracana]